MKTKYHLSILPSDATKIARATNNDYLLKVRSHKLAYLRRSTAIAVLNLCVCPSYNADRAMLTLDLHYSLALAKAFHKHHLPIWESTVR